MYNFQHRKKLTCPLRDVPVAFMLVPVSFFIFSTARVFSCSCERVGRCNEVSGCQNGGRITTEKSAHFQGRYSEVTIPAAMDDSGRQNKKSCQDNGEKPHRVKVHFVLPSFIPVFTPNFH